MDNQHTITAPVQNEPGVLNRLVSLFRRRGFNLASLNVGDCEQEGYSRLSLVVNGDDNTMRQCVRQLTKLIEVVQAEDLPPTESIQRELALIRVSAPSGHRGEIVEIVDILGGRVAHLTNSQVTVEFTAEPAMIDKLIKMLQPYGIQEIVRTGLVAMRAEDPTEANGLPSQQRCVC